MSTSHDFVDRKRLNHDSAFEQQEPSFLAIHAVQIYMYAARLCAAGRGWPSLIRLIARTELAVSLSSKADIYYLSSDSYELHTDNLESLHLGNGMCPHLRIMWRGFTLYVRQRLSIKVR